jgi:large subunit ribosomal protein L6
MSRLARKPILIPKEVTISRDGNFWIFKGPKGEIKKESSSVVLIEETTLESGEKAVKMSLDMRKAKRIKNSKALLGTASALFRNYILGVKDGFEKKLGIEGVGYKVQLDGKDLTLSLGFSHPVKIKAEDGITFGVEKNTITVSGVDKEQVGKMAAIVRSQKPPEPYKGKGIHYDGEFIRRKAGKKAAATA